MKKNIFVKLACVVAFIFLVSVYKSLNVGVVGQGWFQLRYSEVWVGGLIGVMLLYVDYYFYAYHLHPQESASVEARKLVNQKKYLDAVYVVITKRAQNTKLIFHNASFQVFFLVFVFFVVTSSASLLGRGIVFGMVIHLLVDMLNDKSSQGNLDSWFISFPIEVTGVNQTWYLAAQTVSIFALGLFF